MFWFNTLSPRNAAESLSLVIRGLLSVLMGREAGGAMSFAVMQVISMRAARIGQQIAVLLAAHRAGTLPAEAAAAAKVARTRAADATGPARVLSDAAKVAVKLPRKVGWLVALIGYQAAGYGSQLAHLLADPEMAALLAVSPKAVRILIPLGRMLGVAIPGTPAKAPRPPRVRRARAPRVYIPSTRPRRIASRHFIPTGGGVGMDPPPRSVSKTRPG